MMPPPPLPPRSVVSDEGGEREQNDGEQKDSDFDGDANFDDIARLGNWVGTPRGDPSRWLSRSWSMSGRQSPLDPRGGRWWDPDGDGRRGYCRPQCNFAFPTTVTPSVTDNQILKVAMSTFLWFKAFSSKVKRKNREKRRATDR